MLVLALLHIGFSRYFRWKEELAPLSLINRQMMYVHMFFIALIVGLMGAYCFLCTDDLSQSAAGRHIALGISLFWFVRLIVQLFVYSPKLWRGKKFETAIHVLFTMLWVYFAAVFFLVFYPR